MSENRGVIKHIPNIVTLINLACGSLAIYYIFQSDWMMVCILIGIGGLADFLDGLIARALGVSSPIGKELDSLADMISFGLVPGLIIFQLLEPSGSWTAYPPLLPTSNGPMGITHALPALLIPIGAALRLAKFNTLEDTAGDFIGLSTPAATALIIGTVLYAMNEIQFLTADSNFFMMKALDWIFYFFCFGLPLLMNSKIKMFSLKFKGIGWMGNEIRWLFIIGFLVLAILSPWSSIFLIMLLYILTNTILHFYRKLTA